MQRIRWRDEVGVSSGARWSTLKIKVMERVGQGLSPVGWVVGNNDDADPLIYIHINLSVTLLVIYLSIYPYFYQSICLLISLSLSIYYTSIFFLVLSYLYSYLSIRPFIYPTI